MEGLCIQSPRAVLSSIMDFMGVTPMPLQGRRASASEWMCSCSPPFATLLNNTPSARIQSEVISREAKHRTRSREQRESRRFSRSSRLRVSSPGDPRLAGLGDARATSNPCHSNPTRGPGWVKTFRLIAYTKFFASAAPQDIDDAAPDPAQFYKFCGASSFHAAWPASGLGLLGLLRLPRLPSTAAPPRRFRRASAFPKPCDSYLRPWAGSWESPSPCAGVRGPAGDENG